MKLVIHWFRRDLRLEDNVALYHAMSSPFPVLPLFIFDEDIIEDLPPDDARITFIYDALLSIQSQLEAAGRTLHIKKGKPVDVFSSLLKEYDIQGVYTNRDYEPYALERDEAVKSLILSHGKPFHTFKDHVVFEASEIRKDDGFPYTVYTPYSKKWLQKLEKIKPLIEYRTEGRIERFYPRQNEDQFPSIESVGFKRSHIKASEFNLSESLLAEYAAQRNIPGLQGTSRLGVHLRFGTISIRKTVNYVRGLSLVYLKELIWREFFIQILVHFPDVVTKAFKSKYDRIPWVNNRVQFEKWCQGKTGYPMVDAGMRELNTTGFMHNRVRMVCASFLCKHLLIDWRWGESYFAEKLLDYELASNNGNWQWSAGTGCDAAPYFRVFNPTTQQEKFDSDLVYVKRWIPEYGSDDYPAPMVIHKEAREKAIAVYKEALASS